MRYNIFELLNCYAGAPLSLWDGSWYLPNEVKDSLNKEQFHSLEITESLCEMDLVKARIRTRRYRERLKQKEKI